MDRDERDLVRRCLAGDQDACTTLVETHARMVGTVIWRATGDRDAVEDLAQETFLRVFRGLPYFDAQAKLSTWIYTIAHRVAIDYVRQVVRQRGRLDLEPTVLRSVDPEAAVEQQERSRLVHAELGQLPEKHRLALVYAAIDGLDYATIAGMLGVRPGTVKTFVFRGRRQLEERLKRWTGRTLTKL